MKNVKILLLTLFLATLVSGCGGGKENNPASPDEVYIDDGGGADVLDGSDYTEKPFSDPLSVDQWYLKDMNLTEVMKEYDGSGVTVGVADTGFSLDHEDLLGLDVVDKFIHKGARFTNIEYPEGSISPELFLNKSHGTSVLGILAAQSNDVGTRGIASGASFALSGKIGEGAWISMQDIFDMLQRMVDKGASVLSISFSGTAYPEMFKKAMIKMLRDGNGVVFTVAAGNEKWSYPNDGNDHFDEEGTRYEWRWWARENTLVVGASNREQKLASYSNYGEAIDVVAPGGEGDVMTLDIPGEKGASTGDYTNFGGTSAATPMVAGVVALGRQARPDLNATIIIEVLKSTADKIGETPYKKCFPRIGCRNDIFGFGRVNAGKFIKALEAY